MLYLITCLRHSRFPSSTTTTASSLNKVECGVPADDDDVHVDGMTYVNTNKFLGKLTLNTDIGVYSISFELFLFILSFLIIN